MSLGLSMGMALGRRAGVPQAAAAIGTPTFRADTEVTPATAANITFTKPTGTADGDLLVCAISQAGLGAITAPAGWNLINDTLFNASANRMSTYWKIASSEGASYQFDFASVSRLGWMGAYSQTRSALPVDAVPTNNQNQAGVTNAVATGLTTLTANALVIGIWTWTGSRTPTDPADMDQRFAHNGGPGMCVSDLVVASPAATGNKTTVLSSATGAAAQLLAFKASGT
jgi:hypothetical protein